MGPNQEVLSKHLTSKAQAGGKEEQVKGMSRDREAVCVGNEASRGIVFHLHTGKSQLLSSGQLLLPALSPFSRDTGCPTIRKKMKSQRK